MQRYDPNRGVNNLRSLRGVINDKSLHDEHDDNVEIVDNEMSIPLLICIITML